VEGSQYERMPEGPWVPSGRIWRTGGNFDQQDRRHGADGGRTQNQCQTTPCHELPVVVHKPYHRVPPMGDNGIGNATKAVEGNLPKDTNDDINKLPL
jgi:hypothetical protein